MSDFVKRYATTQEPVSGQDFREEAEAVILDAELGKDKEGIIVTLGTLAKDRQEDSHGTGTDYLTLKSNHRDDLSRWSDVHLKGILHSVDALVNASLAQNNQLVDNSADYQRTYRVLQQHLADYAKGIRQLVEGSEATHAVVDVAKYNAAISVESKAPEMLAALDEVFKKYQVGPHAPQQQRGASIAD